MSAITELKAALVVLKVLRAAPGSLTAAEIRSRGQLGRLECEIALRASVAAEFVAVMPGQRLGTVSTYRLTEGAMW